MLKPKGGDIVLLDIQPKVYEVFQLFGFAQFFNIKESFEDAIDHLKSEPPVVETVFQKVFARYLTDVKYFVRTLHVLTVAGIH